MKIPVMQIEADRMPGDEPEAASPLQEPPPPIPPRIGPYELLDSIGKGGMGEVYLALDRRLGRKVTIIAILKNVSPPPPMVSPGADSSFRPPEGWSLPWSERPAVSPDGQYIVFSALPASPDVGREVSLFLLKLGSDEMKHLPGTEGGVSPFWSQDGRSIAFWAKGLMQSIDVPDGTMVPICRIGQSFNGTWNRDGTIIVATLASLGSRLARITVANGEVVLLGSFTEDEIGQYDPKFLPDGRHFFYYSENRNAGEDGIYVASLDAGARRRSVAMETRSAVYVPPGYLLYGKANVLLARRFDLQSLKMAGEPVKITDNLAGIAAGQPMASTAPFSASDNGVLVWRMRSGAPVGTELTWYDRSGRRLGTIASNADYSGPALSRDEKQLAVARLDRTTNTRDLWIFPVGGGTGVRLTSEAADDFDPVWSADGRSVIFTSARNGARNIYRKAADGKGPLEPLFESGGDKHVEDLSPDGDFLVFNSYLEARTGVAMLPGRLPDLSLLRLAGGLKSMTFLATPNREHQAQFSPNGRWVAYCSDETGQLEAFVVAFDPGTGNPGEKQRISVNGASQPRWRGDGKEIFFLEGPTLMRVDVDTEHADFSSGVPSPLFSVNVEKEERRNRFLVTRDGQRFLVVTRIQATGDSTIGVQVNWIATLPK
jgi:Tol biopolymer transport system component